MPFALDGSVRGFFYRADFEGHEREETGSVGPEFILGDHPSSTKEYHARVGSVLGIEAIYAKFVRDDSVSTVNRSISRSMSNVISQRVSSSSTALEGAVGLSSNRRTGFDPSEPIYTDPSLFEVARCSSPKPALIICL